jgi:hypothetical protein
MNKMKAVPIPDNNRINAISEVNDFFFLSLERLSAILTSIVMILPVATTHFDNISKLSIIILLAAICLLFYFPKRNNEVYQRFIGISKVIKWSVLKPN